MSLPNWLPSPMLAQEYTKHSAKLSWPCMGEIKADGIRTICIDGRGYTRNGNTYETFTPHAEAILQVVGPDVAVDCEFMARNWNDTSKLLKRIKDVDHARIRQEVTAYVFDVVDEHAIGKDPYRVRREAVIHVVEELKRLQTGLQFEATPGVVITSPEQMQEAFEAALKMGHEGLMLKDLDGVYVPKRSFAWLKHKPFKDITVTIEAFEHMRGGCPWCTLEGATTTPDKCLRCGGKQELEYLDRLGALLCRMDDGRPVRVGGGFTQAQRDAFWAARNEMKGAKIDIKVQVDPGSNQIVARHPNFLRVREDL